MHSSKDDEDENLDLEIRQRGAEVEDAVGQVSREQSAVRHQQRHEGVGRAGEKSQAADAVRMGGDQAQLDARHLPEKAHPDEQPEIPAQQQELEDRQAHVADTTSRRARASSRRRTASRTTWPHRAPCNGARRPECRRHTRRRSAAPRPAPSCAAGRPTRWRHRSAPWRSPGSARAPGTACTRDRMRWCTTSSATISRGTTTRNRTCTSTSCRKGTATLPPSTCPSSAESTSSGSQQSSEMTTMRWRSMRQRVVGQVRPAQELEQRPAQDEREIRRFPEQLFTGRSRAGFHLPCLSASLA